MKYRAHLKRLFFELVLRTGGGGRLLKRISEQDYVVVLNLHRVSPAANPFWQPLTPGLFDDLLRFLTIHFEVTTFNACPTARSAKPAAILSFDDGYYDFIEYALPLLDKHGLRANQNLVISSVESGLPPWETRIYDFLKAAPRRLINEISLPGFEQRLASDDADHKCGFGLAISKYLKTRSRADREPALREIQKAMDRVDSLAFTRMMSLSDACQIARDHELGAHSFEHDSMAYEDIGFFEADLRSCTTFFEERLGQSLSIYAFPNGSYRQEQVDLLLARGVKHALLVEETFASRRAVVWPRLTLYGDSSPEVRMRTLGYGARSS